MPRSVYISSIYLIKLGLLFHFLIHTILSGVSAYCQDRTPPNLNGKISRGCPLCQFIPINKNSNSTNKDLILVYTDGVGMSLFVRTLRMTGCKATVITFIPHDLIISLPLRFVELVINTCNIILRPIQPFHIPGTSKWCLVTCSRFYFFRQFLIENKHEYDRCFCLDCADTVFQGDPFTSDLGSSSILVFGEGMTLGPHDKLHRQWITAHRDGSDPTYEALDGNVTVCGGIIYGPVRLLIPFFKTLFAKMDKCRKCWLGDGCDQAVLNLMVHGHGLATVIQLGHSPYANVYGYCQFHDKQFPPLGDIRLNNISLLIIHQYDRYHDIRQSVEAKCHSDYFGAWERTRREPCTVRSSPIRSLIPQSLSSS